MNFLPVTTVIPNREPFSSGPRCIDQKALPWPEFFDRTQDHLRALYHARLGWEWSMDREDFDYGTYVSAASDQIGKFWIDSASFGLTTSFAVPTSPGEHGTWTGLSGAGAYLYRMYSAACDVGTRDWMISCKVRVVSRARLDTIFNKGLWIGTGIGAGYPAFVGGSSTGAVDAPNWYAQYDNTYYDTGIPLYDDSTASLSGEVPWYVLQICRNGDVVRWFVNGKLCWLNTQAGRREGISLAGVSLPVFRRYFETRRNPGPVNDGFYMDFFHRLCRRS